jgi:uncharacterized protein (DUF2235 family)
VKKQRLILLFDGTWNDPEDQTNVFRLAGRIREYDGDVRQQFFYNPGVGTTKLDHFRGGVFGYGLSKNLLQGYEWLAKHYADEDEIWIFGFSRGAYTARSLAGLLSTSGLVARRHAGRAYEAIEHYRKRETSQSFLEAMLDFRSRFSELCISEDEEEWRRRNIEGYAHGARPRLKVNYLGIWDTVGSLGIPGYIAFASAVNRAYQFHDVSLSPMVDRARHAVAIDERKHDFAPTLWNNLDQLNEMRGADPAGADAPYQQVWFPGVHGSVGGGGERRGLSDAALV